MKFDLFEQFDYSLIICSFILGVITIAFFSNPLFFIFSICLNYLYNLIRVIISSNIKSKFFLSMIDHFFYIFLLIIIFNSISHISGAFAVCSLFVFPAILAYIFFFSLIAVSATTTSSVNNFFIFFATQIFNYVYFLILTNNVYCLYNIFLADLVNTFFLVYFIN